MGWIGAYPREATPPARRVRGEQGRDPYDGLRPWSAVTHGAGAVLALVGTLWLLGRAAALEQDLWHWVSFAVYGLSMTGLYTASTLYHCLRVSVKGRKALRKYDHCSIALLIAGSYTPVCLITLRELGAWGWGIFSVIWVMAAASCGLSLIWIDAPRWLTAGVYLVMGWLSVTALYPLSAALPAAGMAWLLAGGLFYTVGGILYAVKWPGRDNPRFGSHEVFHLFILAGSICHFPVMAGL